ncbi:MAG: helix-turn-helix domain-containing protein [Acidaminococcaceae bacterium]|nr:helix-turn-helix domain-containing protein [Acidaminococcaceae bacterium]
MMEADAVMDVGKVLQDARVAKELTLERAAQETNIRKAYLEAIEQNDFATLQGDVFVKGIMRTYGNYLGLDGAKLVEEYKAANAGNCPVKNNNAIRESRDVKVRPTFKSNRDIGSGNGNDHRLLFIIIGILALVLSAAGVFYYYLAQTGRAANLPLPFSVGASAETKEKNNEVKEQSKESSLSGKENKVQEKQTAVPQETKSASAVTPGETKKITKLKLTSAGKCWLRVTDQKGTVLFEGNLLKGESKTFTSSSDIVMRIGNLKELQVEYNGKLLPPEDPKEAVTRTYTPAETTQVN